MMSLGKRIRVILENDDEYENAELLEIANKIESFERLAHDMRKEQKGFFSCKDPNKKREHLSKSKALERSLDSVLNQMGYDQQQSLF